MTVPSAMSTSSLTVAEAFRTHAGLVERVLRRAGVAERDLGDLRQEVFVVVHRQLAQFEGRSSLSTWLYRIAMHVASDHRRRAYQRRERLADGDAAADFSEPRESRAALSASPACDPLASLEQRELLAHVLRALETLDADKREAFVLSELYELPMREVASRLGCPAKTAFSRTYAARRRILAELHKHGALGLFALIGSPLRALRGLKLGPSAAHGALAASSALTPLGWSGALASACVLVWMMSAPSPVQPVPPAVRASSAPSASAEGRVLPVASVVATSAAAVELERAAQAETARPVRLGATAVRALRATPTAVPAAQPESASAALPEVVSDEMLVVREGAMDLRPQSWNPLARVAEPPAPPPRIRVRGPGDAADGVENALASDSVFAYPIGE